MNNKKIFSISFILILSFQSLVFGQGSRFFNMEEAVMMVDKTTNKSLRPKSVAQMQWLPSGNKYSYVSSNKLFILTLEDGKLDTSINLKVLNSAILLLDKKLKFDFFPAIEWLDNDNFKIAHQNKYYNFNVSNTVFRELISFPADAQHIEYLSSKNVMAYVNNNNIEIKWNEKTMTVTNDGGKGIVYGQSVHRNEFGIHKGLFWSPKGNKLAFYRMDETMVTDYPIYDNTKNPATQYNTKYPIAGAKSHHVTLGVYDLNTNQTIYLETGLPADKYLTNISWSPDESSIYIQEVNRGQNQLFLNKYNAEKGFLEGNVLEERNEKYVEPENPILFIPNQENKFIYQSEKDGFNHLYLYNTNGKLIQQITSGKWMVTEIKGFDESGEKIFFESTKESPLERHLYSIDLNGNNLKKLTPEQGVNFSILNSKGSAFINSLSNPTTPKKISIINSNGDLMKEILNAPNPLSDFKLGETTIFPIVNNGTVLYCRMITPPDFDKNKKYPVVIYVYGGPHAQMITNSWLSGSNLWMQLMAQQGFIVFTLDNRGSSHRGFEFESSVHRQLGVNELNDQLAGLNYIKKLSYVDENRIGVHGWSFGGFMTTTMMTRTPGYFKVGVAGGPVIDWSLYEVMYTERYMDTPDENKEGYKNSNLLNYIKNLDGKLLMIHGCDDDVVLWQHSLLYVKAAVDAGNTNLDYFVYPGHQHNVMGKDRVHLMQKITNYFMENL